MALSKDYAKGILEEIIQAEAMKAANSGHDPIDLAIVVKTSPSVVIKPSNYDYTYAAEDIVWGFNPATLTVGDTIIVSREPSGYVIAIDLVDAKNPDPTGHPVGEQMFKDVSGLKANTKSWKPLVETRALLPVNRNFGGDTRLVLDENLFYTWSETTSTWNSVGTAIDQLSELLDVTITDPQVNDVLQWNGTKWVNVALDLDDEDKLPLAGGTLTGDLTMPTGTMINLIDPPSDPTDAANKDYVDDAIASVSVSALIPTVSVSAHYSALTTDSVVLVDSTSGARTITLPAANVNGKFYHIKDKLGTAATNNITIVSADGDTIDGGASYTMATNLMSIILVSDGTRWYIL